MLELCRSYGLLSKGYQLNFHIGVLGYVVWKDGLSAVYSNGACNLETVGNRKTIIHGIACLTHVSKCQPYTQYKCVDLYIGILVRRYILLL